MSGICADSLSAAARLFPRLAEPAGSGEMGARLHGQRGHGDVPPYAASSHNLEPVGIDSALKAPAHNHVPVRLFALHVARPADGSLQVCTNTALHPAVNQQMVAYSEFADNDGIGCNHGRSGACVAVRTMSVNESH